MDVNVAVDTQQMLAAKAKSADASRGTEQAQSATPEAQPAAAISGTASAASATANGAAPKRAYPAPAEVPTQQGPKGIGFDFNDGCRVVLPEADKPWHVRLSDLDTGNILFDTEL
jgi:hypothetical protein